MIGFVLQSARQQTGRFDFDRFILQGLRAYTYRFRPLDFTRDFGKTETAFCSNCAALAPSNQWVDQDQRHRRLWIDIFAV